MDVFEKKVQMTIRLDEQGEILPRHGTGLSGPHQPGAGDVCPDADRADQRHRPAPPGAAGGGGVSGGGASSRGGCYPCGSGGQGPSVGSPLARVPLARAGRGGRTAVPPLSIRDATRQLTDRYAFNARVSESATTSPPSRLSKSIASPIRSMPGEDIARRASGGHKHAIRQLPRMPEAPKGI